MNGEEIRVKVLERVKNLENSYEKPLKRGLKKLKGKRYYAPRLIK